MLSILTPLLKKPTSLIANYKPVSLRPFIAKTLERVVFNQVLLFLSQNNKLDAKQSGFRSGHSTETALLWSLWSHWSPVTCKSRLQIISPHSAGSICRFWHGHSSDPPVHTLITGIPPRWFESYLTGRSFRVAWGGEAFLHIHYITGSHHTGAWLLLTLVHRWHTTLSLISTRWSNSSCTDLRLPGGHLSMDERTSPTNQSGKDWASCLPCHSNSTTWLHNSVRFINNYPISFSQKSWCNLWWPTDLQRVKPSKSKLQRLRDHSPEHSLSPFLAGGMIFLPLSGMLDPSQPSSNNWKLISFNTTWLHHKLNVKKKTFFFFTFSKT